MTRQFASLREFLRSGSLGIVLQVANRVVMLLVGVMLARQLGAAEYGHYAYALAWLTCLVILADLGVAQYNLREVATLNQQHNMASVRFVTWQGLLLVAGAALVISLVGFFVLRLLPMGDVTDSPAQLFADQQLKALFLVLLLLPLAASVRYLSHILRGLGAMVLGQSLDRLMVPLAVLLGLVVLYILKVELDAVIAIWVQVAAALSVLGIGLLLTKHFSDKSAMQSGLDSQAERKPALSVIRFALPFGLLGGIGILNGQIDILMLGFLVPPDQVGLYRVAVLGAALVGFGLQAANIVLPTLFARLRASKDQVQLQALVTLSARLILLSALPVALVFSIWGEHLLLWVFGTAFADAHSALTILCMGELVGASMGSLGFLLYMSGEERQALIILALTSVVNIILNLLLIPEFGIQGAALATAIGQGLRVCLLYLLVVRRLKLSPSPFRWSGADREA